MIDRPTCIRALSEAADQDLAVQQPTQNVPWLPTSLKTVQSSRDTPQQPYILRATERHATQWQQILHFARARRLARLPKQPRLRAQRMPSKVGMQAAAPTPVVWDTNRLQEIQSCRLRQKPRRPCQQMDPTRHWEGRRQTLSMSTGSPSCRKREERQMELSPKPAADH